MACTVTKKMIEEFYELLSAQDMGGLEQALTHEAVLLFPKTQPLDGREKILKFFRLLFRQYPQLTFQVQTTVIEDCRAAVHWTNQGFTRKKEAYGNEGVTLIEFHKGKVCYLSDFFKNTELF